MVSQPTLYRLSVAFSPQREDSLLRRAELELSAGVPTKKQIGGFNMALPWARIILKASDRCRNVNPAIDDSWDVR